MEVYHKFIILLLKLGTLLYFIVNYLLLISINKIKKYRYIIYESRKDITGYFVQKDFD